MLTRAAEILPPRSRTLISRCAWGLLIAVGSYAVAAIILGLIPVNRDFREADPGVAIYVRGNGVHADIVVPSATSLHDWQDEFPHPGATTSAPFISFSWGDRGFYLETPRWRDLRASIAFTALSGLGKAVMRVQFAGPPMTEHGDVVVQLSETQYRRLVAHIRYSFQRNSEGRLLPVAVPLNPRGSFYFEAVGSYSLLHTCNDWTRNALTDAGVRMPAWSPFYPAIFHQLRQISPQQL